MATQAPSKTNTGYGRFQKTLSTLTGINPLVVDTWIVAERGKVTNPLNIGAGRVQYATPEAAAQATARALRSDPRYHPILNAAQTGGPKEQLDAIAASPWDAGHYRGNDAAGHPILRNKPGTLLYGIYTSIVGGPPLPGQSNKGGAYSADPPSPLPGYAGGVDSQGNPGASVGGIVGGVESWLSDKALVALLYFSLTGVALGLIVLGLARGTGVSIGGIARTAPPTRRQVQQSQVPF